ncbi:MAG: methylmalonyl Co-A mutase-associated GTPase MeaB [Luminiphilus sp.]
MTEELPSQIAALLKSAGEEDRPALARLLSLLERETAAEAIIRRELNSAPEKSPFVVGFTGAPGAGKSSLINALLPDACDSGEKVAVLAVDPSSPVSGGALLGDRVRMQGHSQGQNVFIRSMASRGDTGGLTRITETAIRLLAHGGWDHILVETLGIGQVELDIVNLATTVVVVLTPGWGDSFQANKAGLTEVGDVFVINKADKEGLNQTRVDLQDSLALLSTPISPGIAETVATTGQGVPELWQMIRAQTIAMTDAGLIDQRRSQRGRKLAEKALLKHIESQAKDFLTTEEGEGILEDISLRKVTFEEAINHIFNKR